MEEETDGAADSLEVELVVEDLVVLAVLQGLLVTPLRKTITQTKTMTLVKRKTMDLEELVALTMTTTMTLTMTTTTTDVIEVVVSEGLLVDVRTVLALPAWTIRDRTTARMGQLLPGMLNMSVEFRRGPKYEGSFQPALKKKGFRLVQLEDGRGAPITKDLSALMEAGDDEMLRFEEQHYNA